MDVGKRIKYIRKLRGITQKELGRRIGFGEQTADIRIAQYESGQRKPKKDCVLDIAKVLRVTPHALDIPNINSMNDIIHILFALEDECGLKVDFNVEQFYLSMFNNEQDHLMFFSFLLDWKEKAEALASGSLSKEDYDIWRFNYSVDTSY